MRQPSAQATIVIFSTGVLLLLFTLGCSGGRGGNAAPIRLGYLQSDLHHLPAFVAIEKGFFKSEGLDVQVSGIFRAGPEEMSAFAAGELDVGYVGQAPATTAVLNAVADVTFLAQVNLEGSALVCRPHDGYTSLNDLRGKSIAIPGHATMQDCILRKGMQAQGLLSESIRLIVLKPPEMLQALSSGNIDAFIAWEPYPAQATAGGTGAVVARSNTLWQQHPCCVLVAGSTFVRLHPAYARKIVSAHRRACAFIAANSAEAVAIGMKYTGMQRATIEQALPHIQFTPELDRAKAQAFVSFLTELNYLSAARSARRQLTFYDAPE